MRYSFLLYLHAHYKSAIASLCQGMCFIGYVCLMGGVGGTIILPSSPFAPPTGQSVLILTAPTVRSNIVAIPKQPLLKPDVLRGRSCFFQYLYRRRVIE